MDPVSVQPEEVQQLIIVLERFEIHKHCPRRVGRVGDEHVLCRAAIELVDEPGIYGSKGQIPGVVDLLHFGNILKEPQ